MTECRVTDVTARVVETPRKPLIFVLVETAAGRVGAGEAAANTDPDTVVAAIRAAADELVGSDPFDTNRLFDAAFETSVLTRSGLNPAPTD
jgi:L-alanine-DL-glutamate epimerase-like enolase superfamily enzyme